jgi:hypothetical protein
VCDQHKCDLLIVSRKSLKTYSQGVCLSIVQLILLVSKFFFVIVGTHRSSGCQWMMQAGVRML